MESKRLRPTVGAWPCVSGNCGQIAAKSFYALLLSDKYRARLKVADMLELLWFCLDQHQLGNKGIDECFWTGVDHLRAKSQEPQVTAMVNELCVVVENT